MTLAHFDSISPQILSQSVSGNGEEFSNLILFAGAAMFVVHFRASEGKTVEITYRGPVEPTMHDILGGVRSTCTYVGAAKLKELPKRTTFIRVTQQLNEVFTPFTKEG